MKIEFIFLCLFLIACKPVPTQTEDIDLTTHFEKNNNQTVTYQQGIDYWRKLAASTSQISTIDFGATDAGYPLQIAILSKEGFASLDALNKSTKPLLFINNAIHAGEPCGVDATMLFYRDIIEDSTKSKWLDKVNIVAITMYNIGGVLNRNSTTRTNQNGPEEYGFRGNARNLDLNRDFIKADAENTQSFHRLFSQLQPEVFIDNHTTNGADYQHIMTLIHSMPEHYEEPLRSIYTKALIPHLYQSMQKLDKPLIPYVNFNGNTPFDGINQFNDLPRYSMGYASLFNTLAFTAEAHMLKPYEQRVWATYDLMNSLTEWLSENGEKLLAAKQTAVQSLRHKKTHTIDWDLDTTQYDLIDFYGYEFGYKTSNVSGKERLFYDNQKPVTQKIKFWNSYQAKTEIEKPTAYIIPYAYKELADWMENNGVEVNQIGNTEKTKMVKAYQILDYSSPAKPYEGHFLHRNILVDEIDLEKTFSPHDYIIYLDQDLQKLIIETLEPHAPDSFFAWNYFDSVLQQKEYFSAYVFEEEAEALLTQNPAWRAELETKKAQDPDFANNAWAQLYFVYKKSDRYEKTVNLYPIFKID